MEKSKNIVDNDELYSMLDRGIDDFESGHELQLDDAFDKIGEIVERRKLERA